MNAADVLDILNRGGVLGMLVLIILGLQRRWWVPGWFYRQEQERGDQWQELAMTGTRLAEYASAKDERRRTSTRRTSTP